MDETSTEALYLEQRASASLAMAAAATDRCAQIAHIAFAKLYGKAIDTLVAKPRRPSVQTLFTDAGFAQAVPAIRERAEDERKLASTMILSR